METKGALAALSDQQLLSEVGRLAANERQATADLVASLAELDARRLYLGEGCSSLFTYCTERLHLSEHAAYRRIEAARAGRRFPLVLERLREGALTLTAIGLLSAALTEENHRELVDAARHETKRAIEALVARVRPVPDVASSSRKVAAHGGVPAMAQPEQAAAPVYGAATPDASPKTGGCPAVAPLLEVEPHARPVVAPRPRGAVLRPLSAARYQLQVTVPEETHAKLRRAQDLLRHVIPNGDPAAIVDRALTVLIEQLERQKFAALKHAPRPVAPGRTASTARTVAARAARAEPTSAPDATPAPYDAAAPSAAPVARLPSKRSRKIPAPIRRAVWARDEGRCAFVGASGRCTERGFLEFHHVTPFADGGAATVENVELRCRGHNGYEAARWFGSDPERLLDAAPTRSGPS